MKRSRRWLSFLLCFVAGCSTRPMLDLFDTFKPGKLGPNKVQPYGGVAIPQGPIVPAGLPVIGTPTPLVVPPPAPLPGNRPPGAVELQPPPFPPIPPAPPPNFRP